MILVITVALGHAGLGETTGIMIIIISIMVVGLDTSAGPDSPAGLEEIVGHGKPAGLEKAAVHVSLSHTYLRFKAFGLFLFAYFILPLSQIPLSDLAYQTLLSDYYVIINLLLIVFAL
jgi:hypothetical protein